MDIEVSVDRNVTRVLLNRPEKRNALTLDMRVELGDIFERLALDETVRAIVLAGAGASFCSGADVSTMGSTDLAGSQTRIMHLHRSIQSIYRIGKPVIAAVQGHAVGFGWSLALAADMVIAGESAKFAQVFKNVGLAPDGGAIYLLSRQIGTPRAKELVFTARQVDAAEALSLGLVNRVVPDGALGATVDELAGAMANAPPLAIASAKQLFRASQAPAFEAYLDTEYLVQPVLQQTRDHREGIAAFREKRRPRFEGN